MPENIDRPHPSLRGTGFLLLSLILLSVLISCTEPDPPWDREDTRLLNRWLDSNPSGPAALLTGSLGEQESAVFLQDSPYRADSLLMMRNLLPSLYDAGVRELGVFFLDPENQEEIDRFVTDARSTLSSDAVQAAAEDLIRRSDASLGYVEYRDFLIYVRNFNSEAEVGSPPLRLVGLSSRGKLVSNELEKLVAAAADGSRPVFLWILAADQAVLPTGSDETVGNGIEGPPILKVGHYGPQGEDLPFGGLIDTVCNERNLRDRNFAFSTSEAPFSEWDGLSAETGRDLMIVTSFPYRPVNPLKGFISEDNVSEAAKFFADPGNDKMPGFQVRKLNRFIRRLARQYGRTLETMD